MSYCSPTVFDRVIEVYKKYIKVKQKFYSSRISHILYHVKLILLLIGISTLFIGYEGISIWSYLSAPSTSIGRLRLLDREGNIMTDLPGKWWYSTSYAWHFDHPLVRDIVAIEDRRFFSHYGIDLEWKLGALYENYEAGTTVRWGSTITEQYIKNTYFPTARRTILQKLTEGFWAIIMEVKYSKEEILSKYLDTLYMGNGLYGIQSALDIYFYDRPIEKLSESDILEIITRIKYPNLTPGSDTYKWRIALKLEFASVWEAIPERSKPEFTDIFPYLTIRIREEIGSYCGGRENSLETFLMKVPSDLCTSSDVTITTSIDMSLGIRASELLEGVLYPLEEKNVHNGSIYIWSEKEKKVLAYIGNRNNSRENAIDMITRKRSVWSVLKPFVYLLALEKWWWPDSLILDDTRTYETADTTSSYTPENYIPKAYGPLPLREALWNSLNSATVRLSESLGIGRIYDAYRSAGFDLDHEAGYYGYGISLGAVELSLEDIVSWYRSLTSIWEPEKYLLYDILSKSENRARTYGISSILSTSIPLAVKTGTSTDFRDNWTIGYTPDIIIGVWVGNSNREPMDDISWVTWAGPIYHALAEDLIARGYIRPIDMTPPAGIIETYLCLDTACLQRSASYIRDGWSRKSRPLSRLYYKEDFLTDMTQEEVEKWKIR